MDGSQLMKIAFIMSAWSVKALHNDRKVSSKDCEPFLSSVKIEVSPMLLQAMCTNTNSTTLVVDCGISTRYERVPGLCNSADLNIGKVLMSQPLMSSTVTLQLLQSDQILDVAKVALLSSQHLFHYRISVWGNKNTRFVLAITKKCRNSDNVAGILNAAHGSIKPAPVVHDNDDSPESAQDFQQSQRQSPVKDDFITPLIAKYSLLNQQEEVEQTDKKKIGSQHISDSKMQPTGKDNAGINGESSNIENYRSRLLRPSLVRTTSPRNLNQVWGDNEEGEEDDPKTTTESSELAKLRWMEEKRIMFEKKMKFLRNFHPEINESTPTVTENLSTEEDEEPIEITHPYLSEISKKPPRTDFNKSTDGSASSRDALKQDKGVNDQNPFHGSKEQAENKYYDIEEEQPGSSETILPLLDEATTANIKYKELQYRLLGSSNVPVSQINDTKLLSIIQDTHISNHSAVTKRNEIMLPPTITQEENSNKPQKINRDSDNNNKAGLLDINLTNANPFSLEHKATDNKDSTSVVTLPFSHREKPSETAQILSDSMNETTLLHTPKRNTPNQDHKNDKRLKLFSGTLTTTKPETVSNFLQTSMSSQDINYVTIRNADAETQRTVFQELLTTAPVTRRALIFEMKSKLRPMVSHDSQKPVYQTFKDDSITSAFKTTTGERTHTQSLLPTNRPSFLKMTAANTFKDDTTGNIANNLFGKLASEQKTPIYPSVNSQYIQLGEDKNEETSTPSTRSSLRTINKSSFLPLPGMNNINPSNSPKPLALYPRSEHLKMNLSNVKKTFLHSRYLKAADVKDNHLSSPAQNNTNQEHHFTQKNISETIVASQKKINNTTVFISKQVKIPQVMLADRTLEDSSNSAKQMPSTSQEDIPSSADLHEKQKAETNPQSPQVVNTTVWEDSAQTFTTSAAHHSQTNDSMELSEVSPTPANTGIPQASDEELEDMEKDSFWPIVAGLVIGVPALVVLGIVITVFCRKRLEKPVQLTRLEVATASLDPIV